MSDTSALVPAVATRARVSTGARAAVDAGAGSASDAAEGTWPRSGHVRRCRPLPVQVGAGTGARCVGCGTGKGCRGRCAVNERAGARGHNALLSDHHVARVEFARLKRLEEAGRCPRRLHPSAARGGAWGNRARRGRPQPRVQRVACTPGQVRGRAQHAQSRRPTGTASGSGLVLSAQWWCPNQRFGVLPPCGSRRRGVGSGHRTASANQFKDLGARGLPLTGLPCSATVAVNTLRGG